MQEYKRDVFPVMCFNKLVPAVVEAFHAANVGASG